MKNISLDQLGGIACLDSGTGMCHGLYKDSPFIPNDSRWSLITQGIFAGTPFARRMKYGPMNTPLYPAADGVCKTFGLARSHEWLYIEIDYVSEQRNPALNQYEKAVCVRITESSLPEIVEKTGIGLGEIFHFLVLTIGHWVHARKQLYEEILGFHQRMETEFELFNMMNNQ